MKLTTGMTLPASFVVRSRRQERRLWREQRNRGQRTVGAEAFQFCWCSGVDVNNCCHSVMIAEWRSKENPLTCVVIGKPKKPKRETVRGTKPHSSM